MPCAREWGPLLSKYVDQEVSQDERRVVENHVLECKACVSTLELFRRHDKILESALAGEAFGDLVVDDVMAEIRRVETPAVVAPEVRAPRSLRPWIPVAAAAAVLLLAGGAVLAALSTARDTKNLVARLNDSIDQSRDENLALRNRLHDMELDNMERDMRSSKGPDRSVFAHFTPARSIFVKGTFLGSYDSYEVERSDDRGLTWKSLKAGLIDPAYEDSDIAEDRKYQYRFIAIDGATRIESGIVEHIVPPYVLNPRASMEIRFVACTQDQRQATFKVTRYVNGEERSEYFETKVGERVGGVKDDVDYTSGLTLLAIRQGDEYRGECIRSPGETLAHVITRPNRMAIFSAINPPSSTRSVWRGSAVCVPLPR